MSSQIMITLVACRSFAKSLDQAWSVADQELISKWSDGCLFCKGILSLDSGNVDKSE